MPDDKKKITITDAQLRAARALLKWSAQRLAEASGVSVPTIRRWEAIEGPLRMIQANEQAIRAALEAAGIVFIENTDGQGVMLKPTRRRRSRS